MDRLGQSGETRLALGFTGSPDLGGSPGQSHTPRHPDKLKLPSPRSESWDLGISVKKTTRERGKKPPKNFQMSIPSAEIGYQREM